MNVNVAQFDERSLKLTHPGPGVTVEYEPANLADEASQRARLEVVTAGLIVAIDAALRGKGSASIDGRLMVASVSEDPALEGIISTQPHYDQYERHNIKGLYDLSNTFAGSLLQGQGEYTLGGYGTPEGGVNLLGDKAVSLGFDTDSPQGTRIDDSHWYKRVLQMVASGPNAITTGIYNNNGQHLRERDLRTELEDPRLAVVLGGDPRVRVSDVQPETINEVSYVLSKRDGSKLEENGFRLAAVTDYLSSLTTDGLVYQPYESAKPSMFGARARAFLSHHSSDIGLGVEIVGSPVNSERTVQFVESDKPGDYIVTRNDGTAAELRWLELNVVPVTRVLADRKTAWYTMKQKENILQRDDRREAAEMLSTVTKGIRDRLLNA